MQDALGSWHGYALMAQRVNEASVEHQLALHDTKLHGELMSLAWICFKRSERCRNKFKTIWARQATTVPRLIAQTIGSGADESGDNGYIKHAPDNAEASINS